MANEENILNSLIPLDDFKVQMCTDDREERTAIFCFFMATLSLKQCYDKKYF